MSIVSATIFVRVPPGRLFTFLSTLWETGAAFGDPVGDDLLPASSRMGNGFGLPWAGGRWGLPRATELEVRDYVEPDGWSAVSRPDTRMCWSVRIAPHDGGAGLTCVLRDDPGGFGARMRAAAASPTRKHALTSLLEGWSAAAERQDALRRVRAGLQAMNRSETLELEHPPSPAGDQTPVAHLDRP